MRQSRHPKSCPTFLNLLNCHPELQLKVRKNCDLDFSSQNRTHFFSSHSLSLSDPAIQIVTITISRVLNISGFVSRRRRAGRNATRAP